MGDEAGTSGVSTGDPGATGPLAGLRVLDLGLLVQAPQAAQLLGDLGADVVKVELPGVGDQARWIPLSLEDRRAPFFVGCNRGKRSLTLDLRKDRGREVFLRLVDTADVMVSNFLTGTLERWDLGYEQLSKRNPRLIVGSASAFGPVGPDADRRGADIAGQAEGGLISTIGGETSEVSPVGVTIADHVGSQNLTAGILAALYARERTGRGQHVQVSLVGGQIFAQASELTATFLGAPPGRANGGHGLISMIYGVFPTSDSSIAIVGVTVPQREAFFRLIGRPDLWEDERHRAAVFPPQVKAELFAELRRTFATRTRDEWSKTLREGGQRYARVRDHGELAGDEGLFENGYLQRVQHPEWGEISMVGCPIRLSDTPAQPGRIAPELGQHTEEVLLELGYSWEEIASLRDDEVL